MAIEHALPAYTTFNASHDPTEVIPITHIKAYIKQYGGVFRANRDMRAVARRHCANINNIGASISLNSPDDTLAVQCLGWDMLKTVMIDVHLTDDLQPVALMAMIANSPNIGHLYLTTYTDSTQAAIPSMWEDEDEVEDFRKHHGVHFVRSFRKIKDINIDLVCEQSIFKVSSVIGKFVLESWMNKKRSTDTEFTGLLRRCLRLSHPTVTVSTASESKTYSNDGFC